MTTFIVETADQALEAVNYALTNLGPGGDVLTVNPDGSVTQPFSATVISYINQYIDVRYATDASGTTGFSTSPTNATYYGIYNSSASGSPSSAPADYTWYEATGGFGTTRFLFYDTNGGRQIQWFVGTAAPNGDYAQTQDGVTIDLDVLTGSSNRTFLYSVFRNDTAVPATPSTGSYDFSTLTGTPPAGWATAPSTPTPPAVTWVTVATASANVTNLVWTATANSWSTPTQYSGERGIIPMGFVLTPTNPAVANTATLTTWFSAPRTANTAPIGVGYAPISGDVANFTQSGNAAANVTLSYDGAAWVTVDGQVINGNVLITGSVNANRLNANDVYALNVLGGNVTVGNTAGTGFWLQSNTGSAYFGGNITIGDSATIGNNLTIGGNLAISGLVTAGNLQANTVATTTIVPDAVTVVLVASSATANTRSSPTVDTLYSVPNTTPPTFNVSSTNDNLLNSGVVTGNVIVNNPGGSFVVRLNTVLSLYDLTANTRNDSVQLQNLFAGSSTGNLLFAMAPVFAEFSGSNLTPGNLYGVQINQGWNVVSGSASVSSFEYDERNLTIKVIKR